MQLEDLLRKPLWQMTGEEFLFLQNSSLQGANYVPAPVAETSKRGTSMASEVSLRFLDAQYLQPTA